MEGEEGALFLLRRASIIGSDASLEDASPADIAGAREIVQAVDGLPLALDQAAAYIEETECGLVGYLQRFQTQRTLLLHQRGDLIVDHPDPVATTWKLSFQKVEQADAAAADLLRLCAFLAPDAIPEEIISEGADDLGPNLQLVASEPVKLDSAIKELRKYSLVRRDPDAQTFTIHRLVQAVLKDELDKETQRQWADRAVQAVNSAFPSVEYETWPECARLLPHALVCAELIEQWNLSFAEAARLLNQAGIYLSNRGRYLEALPLYQRALTVREQELGPTHPSTAISLNNLAELYRRQGKDAEALPLYQRALAIYEQELGPTHPNTATSLNNLALLYKSQGKYAEALPLYQRALAIDEQAYGPNHPDVATDLNNLAGLYRSQGKDAEALPLYQRALAIKEQELGPTHPSTARGLGNLAELYRRQGKYAEALPLYQRALAISEQAYGPNHPDVATGLNNLAGLYRSQGKHAEALPLYQRALAIHEQELGPNHPSTATTRENYTNLLKKMK
jgi:tetratricopeptide (TPR) repeat protein